jgi:class 3 adenylate cyclase
MQKFERRLEQRHGSTFKLNPISCQLMIGRERFDLGVVNYHHRGACLRVNDKNLPIQNEEAFLQFSIGSKTISEKIKYRVMWENLQESGLFGVEFSTEAKSMLKRSARFQSHRTNTPVIASQDPLDPNRIIYFKVLNTSRTGMLLNTSMTNKHLLPGMELRTAILEVAGIGKADVELFIENSRIGEENTINYGVSIKGNSHNYNALIAKYISLLSSAEAGSDRIEEIHENGFLQKKLSKHLTLRQITTEKEYKDVKKLRFLGYKAVGKISDDKSWEDMGDGLENEGYIIGAYLGGQLVGSCEIRLFQKQGLRLSESVDIFNLPQVRSKNIGEVNKLVVHPSGKHTDIVLGLFQKIHWFGVLNGKPDGIVAAEPRLVSLYEKVGFKKTSAVIPHPVKKDMLLTLMVVHWETYSNAEGMNSFAWSTAFEETQKYFDQYELHIKPEFSPLRKIERKLTEWIYKSGLLKKRNSEKSKVRKARMEDNTSEAPRKTYLDSKWTKPHLNATVLYPYILESEALIGLEATQKILFDCGFNETYFKKTSNWVSIDFFDFFIESFSQLGDPVLLNRRAGYRSVTPEVLGKNFYLVKHFLSPKMAFESFEKLLPKFNKTRHFQVLQSTANSARIRISNPDPSLLPKHPSAKINWFAIIEAYCELMTGKPGVITSHKSAFEGDEYCDFTVVWHEKSSPKKKWLLFGVGLLFLLGLRSGWNLLSLNQYWTELALGISLLALFMTGFKSWFANKKYNEIIQSMTDFEKEADEKYSELQQSKSTLEKSYQEGRLLENIHRDIQRSEDFNLILISALKSLCDNFSFKRSFAMIRDENFQTLRTSAIHNGENQFQVTHQGLDELWSFKIDISQKRENPLVLSSVFHSGQSILITDVDQHLSQLNEVSQRLIRKLNVNGFAAVPIPSETKSWGVLIADKGQTKEVITRRDLVVLQRVAQSIGLALDKKSKLDHEIKIRNIFQKYVPKTVVESTLALKDPQLGGEKKQITCLFLDIRNFTSLSAKLPPETLIQILNEVFNSLHLQVTACHGIIDKFLGDGALVTWGAVPGTNAEPTEILEGAKLFMVEMAELNKRYLQIGIPTIEIGIGIHRGEAIVGNIGSSDRMEYTVIGPTVNIASRLEQLTKVYHSPMVISSAFIPLQQLDQDWVIVPDAAVRGMIQTIPIAYLKTPKSESESRNLDNDSKVRSEAS